MTMRNYMIMGQRMKFWSNIKWFDLLVTPFSFSRNFEREGDEESLELEGDIDGGLALRRKIYIPKDDAKVLKINSSIVAVKVGAGSGGFSRFGPKYYFMLLLYSQICKRVSFYHC